MGKNPKRPAVSVKASIYKMLQEEAAKRGCRVTELVELILEKYDAKKEDHPR